jgi:hypothetical protein
MADACAAPSSRLHGIVPGSWIDGSFYIWIGHGDDVRAWNQLSAARQVLDETVASAGRAAFERAREEVFIAEGSDWCWWYGDDHSSDQDADFDELFRRHLRNVYQLLGQPIPDELFVTNITTSELPSTVTAPSGLLNPTIDGEETSYFEWLGAGTVEARSTAGAMHQIGQTQFVAGIRFGFDRTTLYVRVDIGEGSAVDLLSGGTRIELTFMRPADIRVVLAASGGGDGVRIRAFRRTADGGTEGLPAARIQAAARTIAEIAVPLDWLAVYGTGNELPLTGVVFFLTVLDAHGMAIERHPVGRPIAAPVPDAQFAARHWTA